MESTANPRELGELVGVNVETTAKNCQIVNN